MKLKIQRNKENVIIKFNLILFENKTIIEKEVTIDISKKTEIYLSENDEIKLELSFFDNVELSVKNIKEAIDKNISYIKKIATSMLLATTILTSTVNAAEVTEIKPVNIESVKFVEKNQEVLTENQKIKLLLLDIRKEAVQEFKKLTSQSDYVDLKNIFISLTNEGATDGYFQQFIGDEESIMKSFKKKNMDENLLKQIDFEDNGIIMLYINKEILKLAIDNPEVYKKDVISIVKNVIFHEMTHKYGNQDYEYGEIAAAKNQIYKLSPNSKLVQYLLDTHKEENRKKMFENEFGEISESLKPEHLEINKLLMNNVDTLFNMTKEKIAYLDGNREIGNNYIISNEYLENLIDSADYKQYTSGQDSVVAVGYIYNINKLLIENGYSKNEITDYNKNYLSKNLMVAENFNMDYDKHDAEKIINNILDMITEKALDNSLKVNLSKEVKIGV